jgi:hypothetical protein
MAELFLIALVFVVGFMVVIVLAADMSSAQEYRDTSTPHTPAPPNSYHTEVKHLATLQNHDQVDVTVNIYYLIPAAIAVQSVTPHVLVQTVSVIGYWAAGIQSDARAISQTSYQNLAGRLSRMKNDSFTVTQVLVGNIRPVEQPLAKQSNRKRSKTYQYINNLTSVQELNVFLVEAPRTHPEVWAVPEQREALQIEVKRKIRELLNPEGAP